MSPSIFREFALDEHHVTPGVVRWQLVGLARCLRARDESGGGEALTVERDMAVLGDNASPLAGENISRLDASVEGNVRGALLGSRHSKEGAEAGREALHNEIGISQQADSGLA